MRVAAGAIALLAALVPALASGAKRITGKLSEPGMTVLALDKRGEAAFKVARANGEFSLKPPARHVTLHLRAADGTYGGPVVVRRAEHGRRAILGIDAGADLGLVRVRSGYAKLARRLDGDLVDEDREARAREGVPIGAGNFGRVRSRPRGGFGPGRDRDRDGIPGALDIDDDGDLVLDDIDAPATSTLGAVAAGTQPPNEFGLHPGVSVALESNANSNVGSGDAEVEALLPNFGALSIAIAPGDEAELDCAGDADASPPRPGLLYCSPGGTGMVNVQPIGAPVLEPFPGLPGGDFDPDGDGFGTLFDPPFPPTGIFSFSPGAVARRADLDLSVAQVGAGDLLAQRVDTGAGEELLVSTVPFMFATPAALVSYSDTAGNSGSVDYPGGMPQEFPVSAPPGEDVVVTLTFFRPQRRPIPGELCPPPDGRECAPNEWIDIGHLGYGAGIADVDQLGPRGQCPQTAFTPTDPTELAPPGLTDQLDDHVASGNSFSFQLNLTECFQGTPWNVGEVATVNFQANTQVLSEAGLTGVRFKLE